MSGAEELAEGMAEALAIAKGEQAAASVTIKGHKYVPAAALSTAEARIQELEAALRDADCPRPAKGRPIEETVATCVKAGLCGCCLGTPLMSAEQRDRARRTLRGE